MCPDCDTRARIPVSATRVECACGLVYFVRENRTDRSQVIDPQRRAKPAPPPPGPGTELRKILGCGCDAEWVLRMNDWGPDGCMEHMDEIVGWLGDGSVKTDIPMSDAAARRMINLAIERSRAG